MPLLDRRSLLKGFVAFGGVSVLPRWLLAGDDPVRRKRTLVLLHLEGGNDGLNTVVPYADPRYAALRPGLALDAARVRKLDATHGLHPALVGLETLWHRQRVAIVEGVGYPEPSLSHFRATEIWHTAEPTQLPRVGWVGKALDAQPQQKPLRAVALAKEAPLDLAMSTPGSLSLTSFDRFRLPSGMEAVAALYREGTAGESIRAQVARAGTEALEVARRMAAIELPQGPYTGALGERFKQVEALLGADLDLEAIHLAQGGYDTHAGQLPQHQRLLTELGNNLRVFQERLENKGLGQEGVLFVFSEFGRRVAENLSGGTDHGTAAPVFVIGEGVRAGFHGAAPALDALERDNLVHTTDFRRVFAGLLAGCYEIDPAPLVGAYEPLELLA